MLFRSFFCLLMLTVPGQCALPPGIKNAMRGGEPHEQAEASVDNRKLVVPGASQASGLELRISPPAQAPEEQQEDLDSIMRAEDLKRQAADSDMRKLQADMLHAEYRKLKDIIQAAVQTSR